MDVNERYEEARQLIAGTVTLESRYTIYCALRWR